MVVFCAEESTDGDFCIKGLNHVGVHLNRLWKTWGDE